jgi:hypothetical protein
VSALFAGNQCSVENGKIRGLAEDGVRLGLQARVRGLTITDIARCARTSSAGPAGRSSST